MILTVGENKVAELDENFELIRSVQFNSCKNLNFSQDVAGNLYGFCSGIWSDNSCNPYVVRLNWDNPGNPYWYVCALNDDSVPEPKFVYNGTTTGQDWKDESIGIPLKIQGLSEETGVLIGMDTYYGTDPTSRYLYKLNENGHDLWHFNMYTAFGGQELYGIRANKHGVLILSAASPVSRYNSKFFGVDLQTGAELWETDDNIAYEETVTFGGPNNNLFLAVEYGNGIHEINVQTGEIVNTYNLDLIRFKVDEAGFFYEYDPARRTTAKIEKYSPEGVHIWTNQAPDSGTFSQRIALGFL